MYLEPIFLRPSFHEKIWGGEKIKELFDYDIPGNRIGEAWVISAHKNGPSIIENGPFAGDPLFALWQEMPSLFGKQDADEEFPLLVKIIDAKDWLSVQVHPNDAYANRVENEPYGKTECWYVLDCEPDSEIVFGHHAESKEEFKKLVEQKEWDRLLNRVKVNKGDFFYVPSGTIHGIGKGIVILEIQQSSDITYRVYDYDRKDDDGNLRELHIDAAIEVTNYPHSIPVFQPKTETIGDLIQTQLIREKYFTVYHCKLAGRFTSTVTEDYLLVSVINGEGEIIVNDQSYRIEKGSHFILPATIDKYEFQGDLEMVISHE